MLCARLALAVALVALAAAAPAALAQASWDQSGWEEPRSETGFYADVRGGTFVPLGDSMEGMNTGYGFDAVLGRTLDPNIGIELGVGLFASESDRVLGTMLGVPVDMRATLEVIPITGALRVFLAQGGFRPYVVGGLGAYLVEIGGKGTVGGIGASGSQRETGFGFHGGAGFRAALGGRVSLVVDAVYRAASVNVDTPLVSGDVDVTGLSVTGGLGFTFY